jgi:glycosyltransferase involved in cell wall biosynthesis
MTKPANTCIVIPHFDHVNQFRALLPALAALNLPILIVDDCSPAAAFASLQRLVADLAPGASLIRQDENRGKGAAVITGMKAAQAQGFTHALQIDADGLPVNQPALPRPQQRRPDRASL